MIRYCDERFLRQSNLPVMVRDCLYDRVEPSKMGEPDEGREEAVRLLGINPDAKIVLSLPEVARDRSNGILSTHLVA